MARNPFEMPSKQHLGGSDYVCWLTSDQQNQWHRFFRQTPEYMEQSRLSAEIAIQNKLAGSSNPTIAQQAATKLGELYAAYHTLEDRIFDVAERWYQNTIALGAMGQVQGEAAAQDVTAKQVGVPQADRPMGGRLGEIAGEDQKGQGQGQGQESRQPAGVT